jgi:hypothetical protein
MRAFAVSAGTPNEFVERVRRELAARNLGRYVELSIEGTDLAVRFRWMGTSVLRYRLQTADGGFRADLVSERMSPLHGGFRHAFEERFDQVLGKVGAKTV